MDVEDAAAAATVDSTRGSIILDGTLAKADTPLLKSNVIMVLTWSFIYFLFLLVKADLLWK